MLVKSTAATAIALFAMLTLASPAAQAQDSHPIMVQNSCNKQVRLWINHADGWRNWHPHGEFLFSPYEASTYLTAKGIRLHQRADHNLYYYAESTDGAFSWEGSFATVVNGISLPMKSAGYSFKYAARHIHLTC